MKKIKLILTLLLIVSTSICAQRHYKRGVYQHELAVAAGGGFSGLLYDANEGVCSLGGATFSVDYRVLFTEHLGVMVGAEYAGYNTTVYSSGYEDIIYGLNDGQGLSYDLYSTISGFEEKQHVGYLNIPIMFHFQTTGTLMAVVSAGVKIGIPIYGNYQTKGTTTLFNKGYFPEMDNWAIDQQFMGFGRFDVQNRTEKITFKTAYMASIEAGVKYALKQNLFLSGVLYADYGLNDIVTMHDEKEFIEAQHINDTYTYTKGTILNSSRWNNGQRTPFAEKVVPFALGLKLRLSFQL